MSEILTGKVETIVNTLLNIGERVIEISRNYQITSIWDRQGTIYFSPSSGMLGKKIYELADGNIIKKAWEYVEEGFKTRENIYIELDETGVINPGRYGVRILPVHPDRDFLFLVTESLAGRDEGAITEDLWKKAIDASGDGLWEYNVQTGDIYVSPKWQQVFGYSSGEISKIDDWSRKIHPDDYKRSRALLDEYFSGAAPVYNAEMRYLCKDGSYKWVLTRGVVVSRTSDGKPLKFVGTHSDIDDLKKGKEKYASIAQLMSKLIDNFQAAVLVTDEHGKIVYVNRKFYDMYGMAGEPSELVGTDMMERLEAGMEYYVDQEYFYRRTTEIFTKREMVFNEEWKLKDGRTISRDYVPLMLGENYKGEIWKFRDITEQRDTEKRISALRNFYERILNNFSADIIVLDDQFRFLFVNPSAVSDEPLRKWMIGKTEEDYCRITGRPLYIAARRHEIYKTVVQEGILSEWEERNEKPDGSIEYFLRRVYPLFREDGSLDMLLGYGFDITESVLARHALQTSMDTFENAFEYSGIGIGLLSADGKWLDVNKELCEITGYSKEELLQLTFQDITYYEDQESDLLLVRKMLRKEIKTYNLEKRYISKSKKIVWISLTVSLVWNADETPRFFIAQVVDITKKKQLEDELRRKNSDLESIRISLVNKINQLEELSHIIAHNMRGPLGNIQMLVGAVTAPADDGQNELSGAFTREEALEMIGESSKSLMATLDVLLETTQIKLNKSIPNDDCNIHETVASIIHQLHGIIYEKDADIRYSLDVKYIQYPKIYLESILYNFISNAIKYSRPDVPPVITVTTREVNGRILLSVRDNGLGIDMNRYGSRLFKLNQVFHTGYDSKGVGLFITKTQIESLGGTIEVVSAINQGSEFIVTF